MKTVLLFTVAFAMLFLTGCADVQPDVKPCLDGYTYGFFGGWWHGFIAPFSWIGSLFFPDRIAVYAINNNGGWYTTGFILGIGALSGGTSKAIR